MKFLSAIFLIALLSVVASLFLPWWSIAIAAFIVAVLLPQKPLLSFLAGFLSLLLLWGVLAFIISSRNNNILAHKMSMLMIKSDSPVALILLTAAIGALVAGSASLAGSFLRPVKENR